MIRSYFCLFVAALNPTSYHITMGIIQKEERETFVVENRNLARGGSLA